MAGQLVGFAQHEIENLLPDIEQFADVGEYFDQPVRIYSSGMQARVAFAVATATTPDVLIVDEALSVGDIAFQAKCMQRMHALLERGTTVLFVSHGLNQVRQFCSKALYLANGHVRAWGAADEVCDLYLNDLTGATPPQQAVSSEIASSLPAPPKRNYERDPSLRKNSVNGSAGGSLHLEFLAFEILNFADQPVSNCVPGEKIYFNAVVTANKAVPEGAAVGLLVADKTGYPLLACNSNFYDVRLPQMNPGDVAVMAWGIEWPFYSGEFRIDIGIKPDPDGAEFYDRVFCVKTLASTTPIELLRRNFGGYLHVHADVNVSLIPHT
jgi:lipopolysaccharide transport system ATP-binding protein